MSEATLGIDIGTFETKGVLVSHDGVVLASARRGHRMQVPRPGWAEHDAEGDWWGEFSSVSRELIAVSGLAPEAIGAVGASGIGPCMLPVDAEGDPLMNAVLYGVDTRASAEIAELTAEIGPERLMETTGNALTSQSVGPKILWLRRNRPEIYERAAHFLNSTSFLVRRLTGETVIDHYSAASFQPLYDIRAGEWSREHAERIVPPSRLGRLAWTTEIAGRVTPEAAEATGLGVGTPVIAGTIDAAAEAVSVGVARPGEMMLMYGSTLFGILVTAERIADPRLWSAPWLFPGRHAAMSGLATSGTLTQWFKDRFARELDPADAMRLLAEEAAASPPGANGLIVLPYLSGERTPIHDPHAKGLIFGLDLTHTRGDLFRGVLEGIAYGVRHIFETYGEAGHAPRSVAAVGGGTRNGVWTGAVSDAARIPQILRRETIGASYGDAFLAAVGIGVVGEAEIDRWNPVERRIEPNADRAALYDEGFAVFRQLYERNKDLMHRIGR